MNQIKNASFLDGSQGFTASGGTLVTDDLIFGAPGRTVLTLSHSPGIGNAMTLSSDYPDGPAVTSGELLEVFVMVKSTISGVQAKLQIEGGGEVVIPEKAANLGAAMRGVPHLFRIFRGRVVAPSSGQARIQMTATATTSGAHIFIMFRPYLEKVAANARQRIWTPGLHFSEDLNIPIWPSNFPQFRSDSGQVSALPVRKSYGSDTSRVSNVRIARMPSYRFQGDMEMSALEYDQLERLCYEEAEPFWFVRPDTVQLCHAYWVEDGAPSAQGSLNAVRRVSIGLTLEPV